MCFSLFNNLLTAVAAEQWGYLFLPMLVQILFVALFAINKSGGDKDSYVWRNRVFLLYLFGVLIFNNLYDLVAVFFAGKDTQECGNLPVPFCPALVRSWTMISMILWLGLELYFAACLKYWADNKKEDK